MLQTACDAESAATNSNRACVMSEHSTQSNCPAYDGLTPTDCHGCKSPSEEDSIEIRNVFEPKNLNT